LTSSTPSPTWLPIIVNYLVQKWLWCDPRDRVHVMYYLSFTASRSHRKNDHEPSRSSKNTIESRWCCDCEKLIQKQKWSWCDHDSVLMS
jgi:hypothetical protein